MKRLLNGINITYRFSKKGTGTPVLLLHGWGGNLNSFRALESFLISNSFSVITLDFPGFGGSDQPKESFDIYDYSKIVTQLLMAENIKKVNVVAHSFGGRVALLLASQHPDLIEKLVLCDIAGIKPKFSLSKTIKVWRYKFLKRLKKAGLYKRDILSFGSDDYRAMPQNLRPVFSRIVSKDLSFTLSSIISPTLIIWGKDDKETPIYMAKKINKGIADSAIITFDGGHFCYLNNSEKFNIIVSHFLR